MRFSLVTATLGRTEEVRALLVSLTLQTFTDFELIIVDQNDDDRLLPILTAFPALNIRHLRCPVQALSLARNRGFDRCVGTIVAFPDDDCLYRPETLALVNACFAADPSLALLSGPAISSEGTLSSGRWLASGGPITLATVWTAVIAFNLFIRRDLVAEVGGFDLALGVGARFGSAEDTDLAIRVLQAGGKGVFNPSLQVVHPDKRLTQAAVARAFSYGTGLGRVLRKHRVPRLVLLQFFIRPMGGMLWSLMRLRLLHVRYYGKTLLGRMTGYLASVPTEERPRNMALAGIASGSRPPEDSAVALSAGDEAYLRAASPEGDEPSGPPYRRSPT
jgi:GT2 family glycosyltransferase